MRDMVAPVSMPRRSVAAAGGMRRMRESTTTPEIGSVSASATANGGRSSVTPRCRTTGAQNGAARGRSLCTSAESTTTR